MVSSFTTASQVFVGTVPLFYLCIRHTGTQARLCVTCAPINLTLLTAAILEALFAHLQNLCGVIRLPFA